MLNFGTKPAPNATSIPNPFATKGSTTNFPQGLRLQFALVKNPDPTKIGDQIGAVVAFGQSAQPVAPFVCLPLYHVGSSIPIFKGGKDGNTVVTCTVDYVATLGPAPNNNTIG